MDGDLSISNYCACFIDLLGQQDALKDEGLIPIMNSDEDEEKFINKVKTSVGAIERLQQQAKIFITPPSPNISKREELSGNEKTHYDEMGQGKTKQQRWSDGLVFYTSLNENKCPMNSIFEIFSIAGSLCFTGLSGKQPLRGSIEIAWGAELHENELYGAVVAKSYELESKVAQYPRIVIGQLAINYLTDIKEFKVSDNDKLGLYNKSLAKICLEMTTIDLDGHYILNYLGQEFTKRVSYSQSKDLYEMAYDFINEQYKLHRKHKNSKLALRYTWLKGYYDQYKNTHT